MMKSSKEWLLSGIGMLLLILTGIFLTIALSPIIHQWEVGSAHLEAFSGLDAHTSISIV